MNYYKNLFIFFSFYFFTDSFLIPTENRRMNHIFRNSKAVLLRTKRKLDVNCQKLELMPSEAIIEETTRMTLDDCCNIVWSENSEFVFIFSLLLFEALRSCIKKTRPKERELLFNILTPILIHESLRFLLESK
jgi:hypothetical protein